MLRKTLTIFSLIGLLLSAGCWARSQLSIDSLVVPTAGKDNFVFSSRLGLIEIGLHHDSRRVFTGDVEYHISDAQEYRRSMREALRTMRDMFPNSTWNPDKSFL